MVGKLGIHSILIYEGSIGWEGGCGAYGVVRPCGSDHGCCTPPLNGRTRRQAICMAAEPPQIPHPDRWTTDGTTNPGSRFRRDGPETVTCMSWENFPSTGCRAALNPFCVAPLARGLPWGTSHGVPGHYRPVVNRILGPRPFEGSIVRDVRPLSIRYEWAFQERGNTPIDTVFEITVFRCWPD